MSLDYLYKSSFNNKSFNKVTYYIIGVVILIIIFSVYFIFKQNDKQQDVSNSQSTVSPTTTSMTENQKLSILQALDQTSDKNNQLSDKQKLNLLKSLH